MDMPVLAEPQELTLFHFEPANSEERYEEMARKCRGTIYYQHN